MCSAGAPAREMPAFRITVRCKCTPSQKLLGGTRLRWRVHACHLIREGTSHSDPLGPCIRACLQACRPTYLLTSLQALRKHFECLKSFRRRKRAWGREHFGKGTSSLVPGPPKSPALQRLREASTAQENAANSFNFVPYCIRPAACQPLCLPHFSFLTHRFFCTNMRS